MKFTRENRASIAFELEWKSALATHTDRTLIPKADLWRDVVPSDIEKALTGSEAGDVLGFSLSPGTAVPPRRDEEVLAVRRRDVRRPPPLCGEALRSGRFYPRGILAASGRFFREDIRPFRVVGLDGEWIIVDTNHPLSTFQIELRANIVKVFGKGNMLGGSCSAWLETVTSDGPGMEGRWNDAITDFGEKNAWKRADEGDDALFYDSPRIIGHIDSQAGSFLCEEYGCRIPEGGKVLDLMSSVQSHLPAGRGLCVTGLGMNAGEMEANPRLGERIVHDLNCSPEIPLEDGSFDAVTCSLSYEYLTRPVEVMSEAARVVTPGGVLLVGLSDRWFPPKVTRLWTRLHEFERVGLVLEHLCRDGSFEDFSTLSIRGWPRPVDDRHYGQTRISDPVHVISAVKRR